MAIKTESAVDCNPYLIFLADDDKEDCLLFEEILRDIDPKIKLRVFENGGLLIDLLLRAYPLLDCIFLDLNLHLMDGEECLRVIRGSILLEDVPVVIYSTTLDLKFAEHLRLLGADLYLKKASKFGEMKIGVSDCLNRLASGMLGHVDGTGYIVND